MAIRAGDVNRSEWDCTLEDGGRALRLGMRRVKGLREDEAKAIVDAVRASGPFVTPLDLWKAAGVSAPSLRALARADAFGSMNLDRQHALWQLQRLPNKPLPLLERATAIRVNVGLPPIEEVEQVSLDYHTLGLSLKAHPLSFMRSRLSRRGVVTAVDAKDERRSPHGRRVAVAGMVLFRQRPGTAKGVMFMTLEDETGRVDLIVRPHIYERYREAAVYSRLVLAWGRVERKGRVVHVLVNVFENIEPWTPALPHLSRDFR